MKLTSQKSKLQAAIIAKSILMESYLMTAVNDSK
jgi:hypothetical protein